MTPDTPRGGEPQDPGGAFRDKVPPRPAPFLTSRQMGPQRACLITDRSASHLL